MPEGPELHLASRFINESCRGRIFTGQIVKSEVHKSEEIQFKSNAYTISARSRGKEIQLYLCADDDAKSKQVKKLKKNVQPSSTTILFRFGMSGKFEFTAESAVHKHAHLKFYTREKPRMVLSYVDVRRFGRFEETTSWGKDRGPDPMFEYQDFRLNVLNNLSSSDFGHPICEVLLNQKYFNGIGNYLRAEILYRLHIPPFELARKVFEGLPEAPPDVKPKVKGQKAKMKEEADILHLCHTVPLEVVSLGGAGYDPEGNKSESYTAFTEWLQCYYKADMKNVADHNGRTIWFSGPAGPMTPKEGKSRGQGKRKSKNTVKDKTKRVKKDLVKTPVKMETPVNGVQENSHQRQRKKHRQERGPRAKNSKSPKGFNKSIRRSERLKNT